MRVRAPRLLVRERILGLLHGIRLGFLAAVASAVAFTTVTDVFGFLLFLGIASAAISQLI